MLTMAELASADGKWWTCSICGDIHESELNDKDRESVSGTEVAP